MYFYVDVLKTFASLLITNSHLDCMYPTDALNVGGALGNAIFFFVAGYCLSTKASGHFGNWLKDRILRVYFPFVLVQTGLVLIGFYSVDLNNVVELFVWPYITAWFICAILLFYVAFSFCRKLL